MSRLLWLACSALLALTVGGGRWSTSEAAVRRYQAEVAQGTVPIGRPPKSS